MALFAMAKGKPMGPDGILVDVFMHHWEIVKHDLVQVSLHFFRHHYWLRSLNHAFKTLVPKK